MQIDQSPQLSERGEDSDLRTQFICLSRFCSSSFVGVKLPAGTLILSGGITEAVAVQAGDNVTLRVQGMGSTSIRFV